MFGSRDDALYARVQELEGRVERLSARLGTLLDDEDRHARLIEMTTRAEGALRSLRELTEPAGVGEPRFEAALDTVYRAKTYGYVAVYFVGGRTARMRLLVGPQSPPTTSVGYANSGSEINSYMGGVVRPGEYWMAATHRTGMKAGFECIFTPLF
ncbi:hypothetical protein [Actinophytocola sp.]|uniref:hypothetical protein n=1 Tax=Actinophytocola sp. TaxID=1872138 RepID=UPI002ED3BAB1